jgi:hypothetical protein
MLKNQKQILNKGNQHFAFLTFRIRYGIKDEASFSNMLYSSSINMANTVCKYSRPFNKTDGFVSKNRKVIHFKIKSKLATVALTLCGKS